MGEIAKHSSQKSRQNIATEDILVVTEISVEGLGCVPKESSDIYWTSTPPNAEDAEHDSEEDNNAYWPCSGTYYDKPDVDSHLIGLDGIECPTVKAFFYVRECSKSLITPGVYHKVPHVFYGEFPVYEKK